MYLKAKPLFSEAKRPMVFLNKEDAEELGVRPLDRIQLSYKKNRIVAIINTTEKFVSAGEIGLYSDVENELQTREGSLIKTEPVDPPESIAFIKKKLSGNNLASAELKKIIEDVVENRLSEIEITAFVIGLYHHGLSVQEAAYLSRAMAQTGKMITTWKKPIYDKHSIGGVPGDKTSMLLVPVVAAAGLTIPKTSSRAITAPAGTADRMECLCPVSLDINEIKRVIEKTNGCLVWGGALDLAPADDIFIEIEYPLSIDPLLLPSVMSKKKAIGANYLVIDIPTGKGVKVKTIAEAQELGSKFIHLGKKLGISVECVSTLGDQPVGYGIGPALEAREVLKTLLEGRGPADLIDKVSNLASVLFDFAGFKDGKQKALDIIKSGKAGKKLTEIIEAQGGNPKIKAEGIPIGPESVEIKSRKSGQVLWINNRVITQTAREAGAPKDKEAGILLHKKTNDNVKKGETLFEIYAKKKHKLKRALKFLRTQDVMKIGKPHEMVLTEIPKEEEKEEFFILER